MESSSLDRVWIKSTWRRSSTRRLRFVFSLVVFRSCVKIDSVDMLKFTHAHKFNVFGFRLVFFNQFLKLSTVITYNVQLPERIACNSDVRNIKNN